MPTDDAPSDVLAIAARFRREAKALRSEADKRERAADVLEAKVAETVDEVEAARAGLTMPRNHATLATDMEAQTRGQKVSRARLTPANKRHPFVAAVKAKGWTVQQAAEKLGYSRSTVQSWYDADKGNRRPIPREAAVAIEAMLGVPLSAWPRIND